MDRKKNALILLFKGPKNKKENYCDVNIEQNVEIPYKYQGWLTLTKIYDATHTKVTPTDNITE